MKNGQSPSESASSAQSLKDQILDGDFPEALDCLWSGNRYISLPHGRGAGTSWNVARALLIRAAEEKLRILCTRETQASITESVHRLLSEQISLLGLAAKYNVQKSTITGSNGSDIIFAGIRTDPNKIKSTEGVDVCWVEEAEKVSEASWRTLIPTIRKDNSQIIITFNPDQETDPTSQRFWLHPPPGAIVKHLTHLDNPWFPPTLRKERDYDYRTDPEAAAHTWGGQFRKVSSAQIFRGKYVVEEFDPFLRFEAKSAVLKPSWTGPYFGADWGFSSDPTTLVKCWRDQTKLYIEHESYGVGIALNEIPALWETIPGAKEHLIRADNSRPETILHVCQLGFHVQAAEKWPGSVEDGIAWLRNHEQIVIHPRCKRTEEEFRLYRFKTDPVTGDILPIIIDKHNHLIDAIRYALQPAIRIPEITDTVTYEEEVSISPELDEFDLRYGV